VNAALVGRVLLPLHEWSKGKPTFPRLRELERSQWLSPEAMRSLQLERLRALLAFAAEHSPYYRDAFAGVGVDPGRLAALGDLARLPLLDRETVRARFDDLRSRAPLGRLQRRSSGGSSGSPVTVLVDMERMGLQEACRLRAHRWFGVEPGEREIILWGSPLELGAQDRVRALRDRLTNSRLLSAFDLGEAALATHLAEIQRVRPAKMYGYASALHVLAQYAERQSAPPPRGLRAIFATAEPLFDFQRKALQSAFGCAVATEYGCRDGGLIALECPEGGLHVAAENVVVEILDPDAEGRGEIAVTNLASRAFPMIRYRTGDVGSLDPAACRCGRGLPLLRSVEGRQTDFLVTPRGRVLHALSVIYLLRELPTLDAFRVVQEAIDRVVVWLQPVRPLSAAERDEIRSRFELLLGAECRVEIEEVVALPRTPSGKFRYVESKVAADALRAIMTRRS